MDVSSTLPTLPAPASSLLAPVAEAADWVLLDELQGRRGVSLTVAVKLEGLRFVACAAWVGTSQRSGEQQSCYHVSDEQQAIARMLTFAAAVRAHLHKKP